MITHNVVARSLVACILVCAASAYAQAQDRRDTTAKNIDPETADFFFEAKITADELHIDDVGEGSISFSYNQLRDTVHWVDRTPIPSAFLPGVTYRNIGLHVTIISSFADINQIVAEAVGDVAIKENATEPKK